MQGIQFEERAENRTMVTGYQPSDAQSSPRLAKLVLLKKYGYEGQASDEFPLGSTFHFVTEPTFHAMDWSLSVGSCNTV
jgi:hypothetical protein